MRGEESWEVFVGCPPALGEGFLAVKARSFGRVAMNCTAFTCMQMGRWQWLISQMANGQLCVV